MSPKIKILFSLLLCTGLITLSGQVRFENLTLKQGLGSNWVNSTGKDARGFIWFSTDNGLSRYDGRAVTTFRNIPGEASSLPYNVVQRIYPYSDYENIVISSGADPVLYNYKTGQFTPILKNSKIFEDRGVSSCIRSHDNFFWFATGLGLVKMDARLNLLKVYDIPNIVKDHPTPNIVNSIYEDKTGILWLAMFHRGIMRFNPREERYTWEKTKKITGHIQVRSITGLPNSDFVYGAIAGKGLVRINIHSLSHTFFRYKAGDQTTLPSDQVNSLCFQNDSLLWIGTLEGLALFNIQTARAVRYFHDPEKPSTIVHNRINEIYIDDQDFLWVSTFGGVSKACLKPERFTKENYKPSEKNTLASDLVYFITRDRFGNQWLGTSKGLNIKDKITGKYYLYVLPKSFPNHTNHEIVRLFIDRDGNHWLGTWGGGLSRCRLPDDFKPGDKIDFTNIYSDTANLKSLSSNFIKEIVADRDGNLYISTWNGGLNFLPDSERNRPRPVFKRFPKSSDPSKGVASLFTAGMLFDREDVLWLITAKGLQRIDFKNNQFEMVFPAPVKSDSKLNWPNFLALGNDTVIWHGTFGGIVKITLTGNKHYRVDIVHRIEDKGVYQLALDNKQRLWFSTLTSEIGCIDTKTGRTGYYSMTEETDGFEFYFGYPLYDIDGRIYFTGNSGYLTFHPDKIWENHYAAPIRLTEAIVSGINYQTQSDVSCISKIVLPYNNNNLQLRFAYLDYYHSDNNSYRYKLSEHHKDWVPIGNSNEIIFANLAPGKYTLWITASNSDGIWKDNPAVLEIEVLPPLWGQWYFRAGVALSVLFVILLFFYLKIKRLHSERLQQNAFSQMLLQSQEGERKRLSKELHDSLGQNLLVVKNWLDLYITTGNKDHSDLEKICDIVQDSITEVKTISTNLHPHQLERLGLTEAIAALARKVADSSGINISVELDNVKDRLPKESEINIYRIFQEALQNIVKHADTETAEIKLKIIEQGILISIRDFGKGFDSLSRDIQSRFTEGLGLKSLKERARLIGGDFSIVSAPGKGTSISITVHL